VLVKPILERILNNEFTTETDHVSDYLTETFPEIKISSLREDIFEWLATRPEFDVSHLAQEEAIRLLAQEIINFDIPDNYPIRKGCARSQYNAKKALAAGLVESIMRLGREFDSLPAHIEKIRALDDR